MPDTESRLRMVVGLGNPGAKYDGTRHNVGFEALNRLSKQLAAPTPQAKFEGQFTTATISNAKLLLVWPLTFMNQSGRCVQAISNFYKIDVERDLVVICDDMSLPLGKLRVRAQGSAGGQKGLHDILRSLGTQSIARLRLGIDPPPPQWDAADYVLGRFRPEEKEIVQEAISRTCDAVLDWFSNDIAHCMNQFN